MGIRVSHKDELFKQAFKNGGAEKQVFFKTKKCVVKPPNFNKKEVWNFGSLRVFGIF